MTFVLVLIIFCLLGITFFLWKSGFVQLAEKPIPLLEKSVMNPRQRKAVMARLDRWKAEGKVSRAEYEKFLNLLEEDWDPPVSE